MRKRKKIRVFFNASVILAGLYSPDGASGTLLSLVKQQKIIGIISEIVWNEVLKNSHKIAIAQKNIKQSMHQYFLIISAPEQSQFYQYKKMVIDEGDIHLFVSTEESRSNYLVSLDKKHVLMLQKQIHAFHIVSPKELIEYLRVKLNLIG